MVTEQKQNQKSKPSAWSIIIKVLIAAASALAGALGLEACKIL
ncbi:MAG: smalltalk protein [Bacteroides sp.]|nr:smalltalk protein [Bacteroides sp.]